MSQATNWSVATTGPETPTAMAQRIKATDDALLSSHSGASAPAYKEIGTIWCDTATADRLIYNVYEGATWVPFLIINTATDSARLTSINPITTLASAATITLAGVESDSIEITGTTGITSFGAARPGLIRFVRFAGALLLTHSSALLLPAATNITTAAGDALIAISLGSGNWRVLSFSPATIRVALAASRTVTSASSAGDRTLVAADAGRLISLGGSSNFTMTFDPAATLGNGWSCDLRATASIIVTLDPSGSETINGATTITILRGQQCRVYSTGSEILTQGLGHEVALDADVLASASSAVTLSLSPGYRSFRLEMDHFEPTSSSGMFVRFSTDGGATFPSAASSYFWAQSYGTASGTQGAYGSGSGGGTTAIELTAGTMGAAAGIRSRHTVWITPRNNTVYGGLQWIGSVAAYTTSGAGGLNASGSDITHIRVLTNNQIAAGATYRLFGVR